MYLFIHTQTKPKTFLNPVGVSLALHSILSQKTPSSASSPTYLDNQFNLILWYLALYTVEEPREQYNIILYHLLFAMEEPREEEG